MVIAPAERRFQAKPVEEESGRKQQRGHSVQTVLQHTITTLSEMFGLSGFPSTLCS